MNTRARLGIPVLAVAAAIALLGTPRASAEGGADNPPARSFPYAVDPLREAALLATDLGLYGASIYLQSVKPSPDFADIRSSRIPFFDRIYVTKHSAGMGTAADALMVASAALPVAVLAPGLLVPRPEVGGIFTIGIMYAETLGFAYAFPAAVKSFVVRYRPYAYSRSSPPDPSDSEIDDSFPSRHATVAFASAVFAGAVFDELEPGSPWSPLVWAAGLGLATATSALRIASGDHFPSDVAAGAVVGALCGFFVPRMHARGGPAAGGGASPAPELAVLPAPGGLVALVRLAY